MSMSEINIKAAKRKKFDTWTHEFTHVEGPPKVVSVAVSVINEAGKFEFEAFSRDWDYPHEIRRDSLEELKLAVEQRIAIIGLGVELQWEDYLMVTMSGNAIETYGRDDARTGQSISLQVERVKCATGKDGKLYCLERHKACPKEVQGSTGQVRGDFTRELIDKHESIVYLPATDANIAAINDIQMRIRQLRLRLVEVMAPERIHETLQNLDNGIPLLANKG